MSKQTYAMNLQFTADASKAKAEVNGLIKSLNQLSSVPLSFKNKDMTREMQEASVAAKSLQRHLESAINTDTGALDFSKLNDSLKKSGTSLNDYAQKIAALGPSGTKSLTQLAKAVTQAELPIKRSNAALKDMMNTLKNTARWQLSSSMLHGFMSATQSAYSYAQDLNESLNNIRIVTGKSSEEMARFASQANDAARALSTTTTKYTDASLIYFQQGLDASEVEKRTEITVKMAQAAGQNVEVVSDQLTSVWNNFYDGTKSLEYYADVMTALGAATASSSDEIAGGLEKFAAIGNTIGLSYEYAASALATITSNTRQSEEVVGTALKTIFARIQGLELGETLEDGVNLNKYSEALEKVGIDIFDQYGELKKMDNILNEMAAKWNTLSNAQQVALAQTVAGVRQYTQLTSLMENWNNGDSDSMIANLQTSYNSAGTLDKQQETYAEGWEAAADRVKAALEGVYDSVLNDDFFIFALNGIEDIIVTVEQLIDSLGGLGGVLTTVGSILLRVFNKEIAQTIRDISYNAMMSTEFGRQKAQQEKNTQASEIGNMLAGGYGGEGSLIGGEISKQYQDQRRLQDELAAKQESMNQEEVLAVQQILDIRRQIGEEIIKARESQESGREKSSKGYEGAMTSLAQNALDAEDMEIDPESLKYFEEQRNQMKMAETGLVNLADATKRYENSQKNLNQVQSNQYASLSQVSSAAKENKNAYNDLKNVIFSFTKESNGAIITVEQAEKIFNDYISSLDGTEQEAEEAAKALAALKGILGSLSQDAQSNMEGTLGIETSDIDLMREGFKEIAHGANEAEEGYRGITNADELFQERLSQSKGIMSDWSNKLVSCAQGMTSLASIIYSAKGAIDTLSNPDASGWEKFTAILTSFGSVVMSTVMMISSFKTAFAGLTLAKVKDQAITLIHTATEVIDAAATKINAKAKEDKAQATDDATEETREDTIANGEHAASELIDAAATKSNDAAKKGLGKSTKGLTKSMKGLGGSTKGLGSAFKGLGSSIKGWVAANGAAIASTALIAAGIAVAVGAIAWGISQYQKYEKAAEQAAAEAALAAENFQKATEAYNQFTGNLNAYESARSGLEGLTEGTFEFKNAVIEANNAAIELLNTYEGLTYTTDKNGLITIDEASLENAQNEQMQKVQNAQTASLIADQNAKEARTTADAKQFQRDELHSSQGGWTGVGNTAAATGVGMASGALIGAGLGSFIPIPVVGNIIGGVLGAAVGGIAGLITGVVGSATGGAASSEEQEALDKLAKVYEEEGNAAFADDASFKALLEREGITDPALVKSLTENREGTMELVQAMHENTEANRALNEQLATEALADNEDVQNSDYTDQITSITSAEMDKYRKSARRKLDDDGWGTKGINSGSGKNDKEAKAVFEEYAKAAGLDLNSVSLSTIKGTDKNRRFVYKDAEGKEQEVSLDTMKDTVAAVNAQGKASKKASRMAEVFKDMEEDEVNTVTAMKTGDTSKMTKSQIDALSKGELTAESLGLSDRDLMNLGFLFPEDFDLEAKKLAKTLEKEMEGISLEGLDESLKGDMSLETMKAIQGQIDNMNLGPMGEEAGKTYTAGLNKMLADVDTEDQQAALEQLGTIDWSNADAMEQADAIMREFGVDIDTTDEEWQEFAAKMQDANRVLPDFSKMSEDLKTVSSIMGGLEFGSVIKDEDYDKLMAYNDEWEEFFVLQADGTRKFIGDKEQMMQATRENIQAQREELNVAKERQEAMKNMKDINWNFDANAAEKLAGGDGKDGKVSQKTLNAYNKEHGTEYATSDELVGNIMADETQKMLDASQEMKDMLADSGYDEATIQTILEEARSGNKERLDAMLSSVSDFMGQDLEAATVELDEMMASTATSIEELNMMLDSGQTNVEAYTKQVNVLAQSATSLEELHKIRDLSEGALSAEQYGQALLKLAENFENCKDEQEAYREALASGNEETVKAAEIALEASIEAGELAEKYNLNADEIEDYAKRLQSLNKDQKISASEATRLAAANMRLDRGVGNLNDNLENYQKALKKSNKGSAEWSKALSDLKTDLADIVNVADGDMLSDTFAEATLDSKDLKLALDGNVDAILRLRLAAADDIIANLDIEGEDKIATVNENWEYLKANMAAGISTSGVNQTELINSFNEMIAAGNMTKEQIEAALSGLNVSANVKTTYVAAKQQVPLTVTETAWMDNGTMTVPVPDGAGGYTNETYTSMKRVTKTYDAGTEETDVMVPQYTIEGTTDEGGVTTAFIEAPAPPKVSHSQTTSGKKEKGGGGGGSKKEPKKAEKKKKSDVVERYKEIEDALDDLRDTFEDVNKSVDRLYGASRITQMQRTNDLLQSEIKLLQQKKKEAQAYLALDKKELNRKASAAGVSFSYDENGNISNYDAQMTKLYNQLDGAIDAANRDGDASEEEQKKIDEIQKKIDELKDAISQYDETRELIEDLDNELDDKFYEWQDNNAEQINYKFEIEMELKDDELQLAEYYMNKISDDFYKRAEGIAYLNKQMDVQTSRLGDYEIYMDELKRAYAEGEISQAAYIEGLNEITDGALDNAAALQELDKQMMAYYGETLTAASEELDKFTERMEHQQSVLEHYLTIMDLMGESTNYAKVGEVLTAQGDMLKDQMETTKQEYLMYAQEADENYLAWMSAENEEEAELYKQRYEDSLALASEAQEEYLSLAESYGEKLREILDNSLSQYAQDLENALTGGTSFDQMSTRWERAASLQEEYLTNTNKIYETTKLMNQAQKQIDKSTSSVAKERLKQFINETNQLQKKGKLSQFELEIQQAKYELLLAELALEDARDAKQQVRLSRDAEGNFGYIYTANAEEVSDAEEKFLEAQNDLYNTALEGANDYAQKYQQTLNEMYDELVDLQQQYLDGAFETEEEYQNAVLETKQYYYSLLEGYSDLYTVAVSTDARVLEDAWTTEFNSMIYNTENWKVEVEKYVGQVGKAFDQWESDMDRLASDVGIGGDLENLTEKVSEVTTEHEKLTDLVNSKVLPALKSEILEVRNLTTEYAKLRKVQLEAIKGFEQVAEKAQEEKKKEVKDEKPKNVAPSATPPKTPSKPQSTQGDGKLKIGDKATLTGQYYYDSYGTNPSGSRYSGVTLGVIIDDLETPPKPGQTHYVHIHSTDGKFKDLGWVAPRQLQGYDTGGYTGEWGSYGKLAMLHEKELILNKKDTQNLLETITLMRDINKMIDMQAAMMQMDNIMKSPGYSAKKHMLQQEALEQKVSIEANFPNVASHFEIEEAFMNLVNQASQYANRK